MMPRYSPHEPPDGFLVAPSKDGFLVLKRRDERSDTNIWDQIDGPFAERWYAVKKADLAYWRAGAFDTINSALAALKHNNTLSPVDFDHEWERVKNHYVYKNDKALM